MGMREKLIKLFEDADCPAHWLFPNNAEMLKLADYLIANNVAPVVPCKDCEHWIPCDSFAGDSLADMQRVGGCPYARFRRLEDDFCSYGERKVN